MSNKTVTPSDYTYFSEKLRARMGLIRPKVLEALAHSRSEAPGESFGEVHDAKDDAFFDRLAGVELAEVRHELDELRDIESAQRRILKQEYGQCLDCGAAIGWARLDVSPTAKRCIGCQEHYERSSA